MYSQMILDLGHRYIKGIGKTIIKNVILSISCISNEKYKYKHNRKIKKC